MFRWSALLFAAYVVLCAAAFFAQGMLLYPAPVWPLPPSAPGAHVERATTSQGTAAYALYAPAPPGASTLVYFHGNGEDVAGQSSLFHAAQRAGLGMYAVEYPGYGLAQAQTPSESAIYASSEALLVHLVELGVSRERVVLEGQSLGTAIATEMARRGYGARLVLISPFTSMREMAARLLPWLPTRWILRDPYDTESKASSLRLPALVIHGTDDPLIPLEMGARVARRLQDSEFIPVPRAHHGDVLPVGGPALLERIACFARGGGRP